MEVFGKIRNHFSTLIGERMFYTKDHKTLDMFDHYAYLGPKRRTLLDSTWAGLFREEVLPDLPLEILEAAMGPGIDILTSW